MHDFEADDINVWLPSLDNKELPAIGGETEEVSSDPDTGKTSNLSLESLDRLIEQNKVK